MNYAELTQAIQDYCENNETSFVTNIPNFVKVAENRIYRTINFPVNYKAQSLTTSIGDKFLALPADFLVPSNIQISVSGAWQNLLVREPSFIRQAYPDDTATGQPKYFALYDNDQMILGPTPDATYSVNLYYYYLPASIVTASTTWLGDFAEEVLLYGSLIEAYTYMKGDADMISLYRERYNEAMVPLKAQAEGRSTTDEYRSDRILSPRG
ncbi:MAG: hypothetical protein EBV86_02595 [Marivivens sp.]|nr:hypothetical protein [Marivivens sp.]